VSYFVDLESDNEGFLARSREGFPRRSFLAQ